MATTASRTTRRRHVSLAEYLAMPEDACRTELIYGEIVMAASPTDPHQDWLHCLGELLRRWTRHRKLGKICFDLDMILDEEKALVYRPDLMFLLAANLNRRKQGRVFGPADLCIEILSASDRPWVQGRKFADYEQYGVPWYWTIQPDPEQPILEEHQLVKGRYLTRTEVSGSAWFAPGLFPGLIFRLPPLLEGDLKAAVKGQAKRLM
jgi:Uma2 family endonuclease